jgi:hypothetical protein
MNDAACLAPRCNVRIKHRDERLPLITLVDDVQDIAGVASEPVEAGDDQLVTRPQELDDGGQFGSPVPAAARHLFRADDAAALGLELR